MNTVIVFGAFVFIAAFSSVYLYNSTGGSFEFVPLYFYNSGDFLSEANAFFFVFFFSLLFFGISAPLALGMEGLKYASLLTIGGTHPYDSVFILPQLIAAFSATIFGTGILRDYSGKGNLLEEVKKGSTYLAYAFGLMLFLFLLRSVFVQ